MEPLKELNQKWWYRLIKVIFVAGVIALAFMSLAFALHEFSPESSKVLDQQKSTIKCENGNQRSYTVEAANQFSNIYITATDLDSKKLVNGEVEYSLPQEYAERLCGFEVDGLDYSAFEGSESEPEYSINKEYREVQSGSYLGLLVALLSFSVAIILVEELIRRIFYYIYLGSFFPEGSWFNKN